MNRFVSPALLALLALVAGAATAQSTQVAPGKEQMQTQQQDPNAKGLDDNAQRAHSREGSSGASKDAKGAKPAGGSTATTGQTASMSGQEGTAQGGARAPADANHDNLVTPEEMEAALKAGGTPSAKPSATTTKKQ